MIMIIIMRTMANIFLNVYYVPGIVLNIAATFEVSKIPCFSSLKEIQDRE